jgi:hypothetical protein
MRQSLTSASFEDLPALDLVFGVGDNPEAQ